MKKIVFLVSGGGGNLAFLHAASSTKQYSELFRVVGVIADRECRALEYAKRFNIPNNKVKFGRHSENTFLSILEEFSPDLIITNIHRILGPDIVNKHRKRLINLHYSLLPAFSGTIGIKPIEQALSVGCKFIGTTVHWVTEDVDAGPIISQSLLAINEKEAFLHLTERVFRSGCLNLLNAILLLSGREPIKNDLSTFAPASGVEASIDEEFWCELKGQLND